MFTSHDGRGRQIARNLTIAALSAALAGSAAAMAADSGGTPSPTKQAVKAADCAKPDAGGKGDRAPLGPDDAVVQEARTRLHALVTAGQVTQAEADAVQAEVTAGSVNLDELVKAGTITATHAETIDAVLRDIKNAHAGDKPAAGDAVKRARVARGI
jgi:Spy/CpxP family protein refolding chaperone